MAETLLGSWWDRLRGRLQPTPCPFSDADLLEMPARGLVASPKRVLGAFELTDGERALEIGPGIGYYSVEAARRVGPSGRLVCLDIQRQMLGGVQQRLGAAGLAADLVEASALSLPLRSASMDRVFLITVLGEFPDRAAGLAEIPPALSPGGPPPGSGA